MRHLRGGIQLNLGTISMYGILFVQRNVQSDQVRRSSCERGASFAGSSRYFVSSLSYINEECMIFFFTLASKLFSLAMR
ncbi:hypothetical protein GOP47_0015914 [Adiantum capillus-veneris]|uniref:Uncharacterized protein n=1 Tax=Adiantum capillus-veneris TaxID=13818 RepID=A0A9D4UKJ6_ADICA|nr:hypothetical protein GOP47_0015914 [Adiantum capillus-veneris]